MEKYSFQYVNYWTMIIITIAVISSIVLQFGLLGIYECSKTCNSVDQSNGYNYSCLMCSDSTAPSCYKTFNSLSDCAKYRRGE